MGRNWVFLRGLVRGVGHWLDFPEKIQRAFPEDQFEFLEIPGNGTLFRQSSPLSIGEMVQQIRVQSLFCQNQKSFYLVGMSLGGMVATEWARLFPRDVESLCLINTSASNYGKIHER